MTIEIYMGVHKQSVLELILHIQNKEFDIPITLDQQPDLLNIPAFYQIGDGNFWIARDGGQVVGTVALLDIGNKEAALRKMFVETNYRGKEIGVAQKLLDNLIVWAKVKGMRALYLGTTEKFIAAQRFYEKNGFSEIAKDKLPTTFPIMDVDVKFYQLFLNVSADNLHE